MNHQESLRITIQERLEQGKSVEGILSQLLERAPYTLLDLVFGPQAIQDERFLTAILVFLEDIEELLPLSRIPIDQFYHRLLSLAGSQEAMLIERLLERHFSKDWMVDLLRRFQSGRYVFNHLLFWAENDEEQVLECAAQYVSLGFAAAVEQYAVEKRESEAIFLLLEAGFCEFAARVCVNLIKSEGETYYMERTAAVLGPQFSQFLELCLGCVQRTSELKALDVYLRWYPSLQPVLIKKIKKMERRRKAGGAKAVNRG
ncbi:MAG: hypothetical protein CMK59_00925 [Proteobacteria bacterium]|nr:hypothetical protein [Pseudomonadota bacterium]